VKEGHKVIATPRHPCYLDYDYKRNSTQNIYEYNPIADDGYSPEAKANVLGVQASFWSHVEHNEVRIDRMIFPRLLAMAATAWASPEKKNWAQFQQKLESHKKYLDKKNVDYFNEE
jgi:hexosaminidase